MPSPRKIVRRLLQGALALGALLVVALAGAWAYTFTDHFRSLARAQLVGYLNAAWKGEIALERIEGSIWGDLVLHELAIRWQGKEIARLPRVEVSYALLPLLGGTVDVTRIEAPDARLSLAQDAEGRWNLAEAISPKVAAPPSEGGSTMAIDLGAVVLTNAEIEAAPAGSPPWRVTGASLDLGVALRGPEITADVRSLALRASRDGLPPLEAQTSLRYAAEGAKSSVEIRGVTLRTPDSSVTVKGAAENVTAPRQATVDAEVAIEKLAPADVVRFVPQWSATEPLTGRLTVKGPASDLRAVAALAVGAAEVEADLAADLAAEAPRWRATAAAREVDVAALAASLGVAGVVSADLRAEGAGTDPLAASGEAKVAVRGLQSAGWRLGDVEAAATLAERRAKLDGAVSIGGAKRVSLDGEVDLGGSETWRVALDVDHFDPSRVAADRSLVAGDLTARARAEGAGFDPATATARLDATISPSRLAGVRIDSGRFDLGVAAGRATIRTAEVRAERAMVSVAGDVGLRPEDRGRLRYDASVEDLAPWLALAGTDGAGSVTLHGTAEGSLADLSTRGRVQAAGLRQGTNAVGAASADYELAGIGTAAGPRGRLDATVENVAAGVALRRAVARASLAEGRRFTVALDVTDGEGREHRLAGDGAAETAGVALRLTELRLTAPDGAWTLAGPAAIRQRGTGVEIDGFVLARGQRRVTIDGKAGAAGAQDLGLEIDRFDLRTLAPLLAGMPRLEGELSAKARVSGTAAAPRLDAEAGVTSLAVAGQRYEGLSATLRYDGTAATFGADFRQDASHRLTAEGRLPMALRWEPAFELAPGGEARVVARSSGLSLAMLNAFAPKTVQGIGGELALDVTASGPLSELRPRGTLALRQGEFRLPEFGTHVRDGAIEVAFDPTTVRIDRIFAAAGEGTLEGGGSVPAVPGSADPIRLALRANRFQLAANHRYKAELGGEIQVAGTTTAPTVRGRLVIPGATLRPDLAFLAGSIPERDPTIRLVSAGAPRPANPAEQANAQAAPAPDAKAPPAPQPQVWRNTEVDVRVTIERNTWVRHEMATIELEGEVHATKRAHDDLRLVGEIQTVRGWAVLQGRRFTVDRGVVRLTGGQQVDPSLDVKADHRAGDYLVSALVTGTANAPKLELTSDPPLEQADILAVLLFGKPASELNDGQKTDLQEKATEIASAYAFSEVGRAVTDALGLAEHGVQVEEVSTERLALGAYVTPRTYVTVAQDLTNRQGQQVTIDYQLFKNWSLETSTSSLGGSGADLIWQRRY